MRLIYTLLLFFITHLIPAQSNPSYAHIVGTYLWQGDLRGTTFSLGATEVKIHKDLTYTIRYYCCLDMDLSKHYTEFDFKEYKGVLEWVNGSLYLMRTVSNGQISLTYIAVKINHARIRYLGPSANDKRVYRRYGSRLKRVRQEQENK